MNTYTMNYEKLANIYKPEKIKILLIGEAPPPNGKNYFYKVPDKYPSRNNLIEDDTSLPGTIFNHYFGRRPIDEKEYEAYLRCLKERGIFLIDILNEAIKIREKNGLNKENLARLTSKKNLQDLEKRINSLITHNTDIIFLLARSVYLNKLKLKFKKVSFITWKCFRLDIREACKRKINFI